jgi:hypothetical protein
MPEVILSQINLINADFILMDYGLIFARVLKKCKSVHIYINLSCWICNKFWLWTRSASVHMLTRQSKYVHHHFSGAWKGRVFPSTGHPDLQTSLHFTLSQLFTNKNTLGSSAPARIWNTSCIILCITDTAKCVICVNCCELHALFADGITFSFQMELMQVRTPIRVVY